VLPPAGGGALHRPAFYKDMSFARSSDRLTDKLNQRIAGVFRRGIRAGLAVAAVLAWL
jgi:hypothetical protein